MGQSAIHRPGCHRGGDRRGVALTGPDHDPRPLPPWPDDVDLRIFAIVEIPRDLLTAPCFADLDPAGRWALMRLIGAAWHQVPAGSLPAHPAALCDLAGFGVDLGAWLAVQDRVLASWTLAQDDRLYFEPLGDVIAEAWGRRRKKRSTSTSQKRRARMRAELSAIGVPDASRLGDDQLERFLEFWIERGGQGFRGETRAGYLMQAASDFGLLPRPGGDVVVDARLRTQFSTRQGGLGHSD